MAISTESCFKLEKSEDIYSDVQKIVSLARNNAYHAVNRALVCRNWMIGYRIAVEQIEGDRAEYGAGIMENLSRKLTEEFGKGFDMSSLYKYYRFYQCFREHKEERREK